MSEPLSKQELSAELIGYHLGLCDAGERRQVEAMLGDRVALDSACRKVERALSSLQLDEIPTPPAHLAASILDRVQESRSLLPFPKRAAELPAPVETGGRGPMFHLRELVGLAAAIALFLGIFVPGYRTARHSAQQAMCANNLRLLGEGYEKYQEIYGNTLPYVRGVLPGDTWLPAAGTTAPQFKNSRNVWVLVSTHLVPGKAFTCPERPHDIPLEIDPPDGLSDFPNPRNIGFATMAVTENWTQRNFDPQMPIAADMNPLTDDADGVPAGSSASENSLSHRGRGQNVLRGNQSVRWSGTPRVGLDNDDIYRLIGVEKYTGQEWPRLRSDAFLIP